MHEFPFAPEDVPRGFEGRDAIAAYTRDLPGIVRFGTLSDVRLREVADELIVAATGHHQRVADGSPMDLSYVWLITWLGGQVIRFRDYMNPLQLAES